MDNALIPWFILVPDTQEVEFYKLSNDQQLESLHKINRLSEILMDNFDVTKLNIATIGNIVSQLHIHIIGRSADDHCWPATAWGNPERTPYSQDQLTQITNIMKKMASDQYSAYPVTLKSHSVDG